MSLSSYLWFFAYSATDSKLRGTPPPLLQRMHQRMGQEAAGDGIGVRRQLAHRSLRDERAAAAGLDVDGDQLTFVVVDGPAHGTLSQVAAVRHVRLQTGINELDRVLGQVVEAADGDFNTLLEIGFAGAIQREWDWRVSRGESLANLQAFRHLVSES